jgi:hypothetical protein
LGFLAVMSISSVGSQRSLRFASCCVAVLQAALVACVGDDDPFFPVVMPTEPAAGGSGSETPVMGGASGRGVQSDAPLGGTSAASGSGASPTGSARDAGSLERDAATPCGPCPCDTGAFGPAEVVTGLAVGGDLYGPAFSASGNELFFSAVEADENIFSALRTGRTAAFSPATPVPNLDAGATDEGTPFLTFDELSLYFFSTRPGPGTAGDRDLWVATRSSSSAAFSAPAVVPSVNGTDLEHLPRLTRDELTLLFVSGRDSPNAGSNIWVAERTSRGDAFGPASELTGANSNAREEGFSLSADGLTLYFSSDRVAPLDMDLWVATRPEQSAAFGAAEPLEALNTTEQELDPALSPDGFELFYASTRNGPVQLFRSVRVCEP